MASIQDKLERALKESLKSAETAQEQVEVLLAALEHERRKKKEMEKNMQEVLKALEKSEREREENKERHSSRMNRLQIQTADMIDMHEQIESGKENYAALQARHEYEMVRNAVLEEQLDEEKARNAVLLAQLAQVDSQVTANMGSLFMQAALDE